MARHPGNLLGSLDDSLAFGWYSRAMRATIDAAGRLVIPKPLREELGFAAGMELELEAVDGRLEVTAPSRVRVEAGPLGVRFATDAPSTLTTAQVRELMERGRR
jgi:AbrB family looped-hinge helix DNA binding protein